MNYMNNLKEQEIKYNTVIDKNTFFYFSKGFEEQYESHINSIRETLLIIKNRIESNGLKKEIFANLLIEKENGLTAILALTGLSLENFKRLITIIRIVDDKELSSLVNKNKWINDDKEIVSEWSDKAISRMIIGNEDFREGIINLFFEGASLS